MLGAVAKRRSPGSSGSGRDGGLVGMPRVAILTAHEGRMDPVSQACTATKRCYAAAYPKEVTFILDTTPYSLKTRRHPTWNRVLACHKHLPQVDWLLYLDSDIAMLNHSIRMGDFLRQLHPQSFLVWTAGQRGFNA
eukprot:RCo053693